MYEQTEKENTDPSHGPTHEHLQIDPRKDLRKDPRDAYRDREQAWCNMGAMLKVCAAFVQHTE